MKALNKGVAQFVVLAADASPIEILLHVPKLCESRVSLRSLRSCASQNVAYVFVPSKAMLGRAAGLDRDVVAVALVERENSALLPQILDLQTRIEDIVI